MNHLPGHTRRRAVVALITAGAAIALAGSGAASVILALFDSQGPAGIIHVQSSNGPFAGAIKAVAGVVDVQTL